MAHDDSQKKLDRFARGIIRRKVNQLIGRAGFTSQDCEDLEQELIVRLLQSLPLFDPAQSHRNVFVTTVVERAAAMILRERRAKKRGNGVVLSLDQEEAGDATEPADPHRSHVEQVDLATDLAEVLDKLPEDLRNLAEQLKYRSLSQVARDMAVARSTLQRQVQRLRQYFEKTDLRIFL
ncbi:MAG: hypothetical protein KatS3mg109_0452 [Pirellulaceae bacterium]|nr:MAG: hypothetical protein KatS3mg109_0452 [Pirellulaceae bacterium]